MKPEELQAEITALDRKIESFIEVVVDKFIEQHEEILALKKQLKDARVS